MTNKITNWEERFDWEFRSYFKGMSEFSNRLHPFIRQLLTETINSIGLEEKEIGDKTHCKTCEGHIAAGECDCVGYNQALKELEAQKQELLTKLNQQNDLPKL